MSTINELVQRLERAGAGAVKERILSKVRDALHAEAVRGFVEQRDPYGNAWAPRKDPSGTWPLLDKTGAGINSLTATVAGNAVRLKIAPYFKFHQSGTGSMVARKVFPEPERGLGTWSEPVHRAAVEAVKELMR